MKKVHALLIARQLTGDSEVLFFNNPNEAILAYQSLTNPLFSIIAENDIAEDEGVYERYDNPFAVRFNSGELSELDETELMDEGNVYVEVISKEVYDDVTHYFADFSEYVDDSTILFHNKESITELYNNTVDEELFSINEVKSGAMIVRGEESTWGDIFYEDDIKQQSFFGFCDVYGTFMIGEIIPVKSFVI
jgi:hypothetical protein